MCRRACVGLVAAVGALVLFTAPAEAKFWQFELAVDSHELAAGDTLHMEVVVASHAVDDAERNSAVHPPVEVYRTDELPTSGFLADENVEPVGAVEWTYIGGGRFGGAVALAEPGSYEVISMGVWNMELEGYPQPVSLTVTEVTPASGAATSDSGLSGGWVAVVAAAAITVLGFGLARRRSKLIAA